MNLIRQVAGAVAGFLPNLPGSGQATAAANAPRAQEASLLQASGRRLVKSDYNLRSRGNGRERVVVAEAGHPIGSSTGRTDAIVVASPSRKVDEVSAPRPNETSNGGGWETMAAAVVRGNARLRCTLHKDWDGTLKRAYDPQDA